MRLIPILFSAALALSAAWPAHAEPSKHDQAAQLVLEAKAARDRGDLETARDLLRRAHKLDAYYESSGNLGRLEMRLGAWRDAAEHLNEALTDLRQHPELQDKLVKAAGFFAQAQSMVVTLRVRVKPAGATVTVPKQEPKTAGEAPLELFLEPGNTPISVTAEGYEAYKDRVIGGPGEIKDLEIVLERPKVGLPVAPAALAASASLPPSQPSDIPATAPEFPSSPAKEPPWWPYAVGGGITAVGLAGGIGFTLAANSSEDEYKKISVPGGNSACRGSDAPAECAHLAETADKVAHQHNLATAGFVVAGAAGLATLGYFIWTRVQPSNSSAVRASAAIAPGSAYATLMGSF